ncbi:hypothetical protein ACHAXR_009077 [Thalassiosira sp. AJA248-18]
MEQDTEKYTVQLPSPDVTPECRSSNSSQKRSQQHASWPGKSESNTQPFRMHPGVMSYHDGDIAKYLHRYNDGDWINAKDLQRGLERSNDSKVSLNDDTGALAAMPFVLPDSAQSPLPFSLEKSAVSVDHDLAQSSSFHSVARKRASPPFAEKGIVDAILVSSSTQMIHDERSISNSDCVPVEGRLVDLVDNDTFSETDESNADESGIVILDESTEEEYEESLRESLENDDAPNAKSAEYPIDITQTNDSIILAAAARVNANPGLPDSGNASVDFERLLQEADDHSESDILPEIEEEDSKNENRIDAPDVPGQNFWERNLFPSSNRRLEPTQPRASATQPSLHTPARATRIRHDKFVVEMDIFPSDTDNSRLNITDVMDIMANIELLHLWFDPVPAVFDAAIKDGSGNSISPRSSPSNSLEDESENHRQYDGQWVEISTPPLTIPSDSRVFGCLRAIRVSLRAMIGFPARIRSMIFVERSSGRIGMTLGPYPDGLLKGTMAYHTFSIRVSDEECGTAENRRCVVISDEVRLQRGGDDGLNGTRGCWVCSFFRCLLGFLEWVLFFRWYQPDLTSFMHQTMSSMEKLRTLVERGESSAYAGGQLIVNGEDPEGESTIGTPLLG